MALQLPSNQIEVLIVEDNPADTELVLRALRRGQIEPKWKCVETEAQYLEALNPNLDLILSDFTLPSFSGMRALEILKEKRYEIPFIIISGTIGEEIAVEAIKKGSTDYLLKDRLARLVPAVSQAMEHSRLRKESRRASQALRESEARYRTLFNCAPDGIFILDPEYHYVDGNQSICQMLGYSLGELTNLAANDIMFEFEPEKLTKYAGLRQECECKRKDGSEFRAEVISTVMPNGNLMGIIRDITEKRRAEEKIVEQAALLDHAQDAIFVRALDGTILFWNNGAERIYQCSKEVAIGQNIGNLLPHFQNSIVEINNKIVSYGENFNECQYKTKDKRELTIESRATLIRGKEGSAPSVLSIDTDITERKNIETQLSRARRLESIGTLASGMAHDLNNILTPTLLSISILKMTITDPEAQDLLETIEQSSRRGADIIQQVLSLAAELK